MSIVPLKACRVLQVYRTFFPDTQGGAEEVIRQIAKNTALAGVETRVIVPSANVVQFERIQFDGVDVYRVPELCELASCNLYRSGFSVLRELVEWADIVHYHYPWPFQDLLHFGLVRQYKKKTLVTYHSDIIRQQIMLKFYRPLKRRFLGDVDCIVATSPAYHKTSPVLSRYNTKVKVIPLGLDETTLPQVCSENLQYWSNRFGEGFFFFVGVLRYYKGLHVLLEAASKSNVEIVIAGAGPEEAALQEQSLRLGLKNVHFLGRIDDADKVVLMRLCRAVVLPSFLRSEAFGVTLLEGMYFSKPLITSDIETGVNYVNQNGLTGLSVRAGCSDALAGAMTCLDGDREMAAQMGVAARERYTDLFTGERLGESYSRLYRELLS